MVNIKFSTRYLVDMLFSRHITSSRRIRTNRKRLAILRDSLPSDGGVLCINILERLSQQLVCRRCRIDWSPGQELELPQRLLPGYLSG